MGKKKEALIHFHKENIMNAARELFESKGIENTTVDDIVKYADYSKSTLYVYFKSKEEILHYVIQEQMENLYELVNESIGKSADFISCFYEICHGLVQYEQEHPVLYQALMGEIPITKQDIEEENIKGKIYITGEKINSALEDVIAKGMEENELRRDLNVLETVFYLWSSISEVIRFSKGKEEYIKIRLEISRQEYMEHAFGMILRSIQ